MYIKMSEEQNIPQENPKEQIPNSNEENVNEKTSQHFPEDSHAPKQPKLENMEVHHHGHIHHQKKWKEYLFQFLMLFLAVTAGFFVGNIREHYIESKRAKGLIRSLISDLQKDTASINWLQDFRINKRKSALDSFFTLLNISPDKVDKKRYYTALINVQEFYTFSPSTGTINQLKNAGYLRYFADNELLKYISDYEFALQDFKNDETMEFHLQYDKLIQLVKQHTDNEDMYQFYVAGVVPAGKGIRTFDPGIFQSLKAYMIEVMWYNNPQMPKQNERVKSKAVDFMNYLHSKYGLE
jgi:hypothetical protein